MGRAFPWHRKEQKEKKVDFQAILPGLFFMMSRYFSYTLPLALLECLKFVPVFLWYIFLLFKR